MKRWKMVDGVIISNVSQAVDADIIGAGYASLHSPCVPQLILCSKKNVRVAGKAS